MRRSFASFLRVELLSVVCLSATVIWFATRLRSDSATIDTLRSQATAAESDRQFPSVGDRVAKIAFRVTRGRDSVAIVDLLSPMQRVMYFRSRTCGACMALETVLDTVRPDWRSAIVLVNADKTGAADVWRLVRPEERNSPVTRVPSVIVTGEDGFVEASVLGNAVGVAAVLSRSSLAQGGALVGLRQRVQQNLDSRARMPAP
jgi:hypothetical protein